ncbi:MULTISPECIES: ferric reductase-like transmembrane domain-containing protein [unclassified Microbacterium]|uniref:ferredoxin reductase family protein n=1 Tax=unclassified Microbacterium TaxID=2609290 RepID=UPI0016572FE2|nr:ferric reductase-like transmembrane domain-containing protein [Microbacterium sp. Nx66]
MSTLRTAPTFTPTVRISKPRVATSWWRVAALGVIWATSLFVVALWVAGGGVTAVLGFSAESVTTLGRLSGLVAANLLLYQVLLMAKVPLFERGFGREGITRFHRQVGFWSFWLMGLHILLLVIGYAAAADVGLWDQLWSFVWDYPGMLLATAGTGLLVMVVITSIRRARRRLRYESWHLLHLYAYLGVFLALPHQLWTGGDFLASTPATIYWWSLWTVAAAAVIVFRVIAPFVRSHRHALRVDTVAPDGAAGITVRVSGRDLRALKARAGQFFVWRFLDGPGWMRGHPFSLSAAPGDTYALTARLVGDGTTRLASLRPGTRVLVEGPFGEMTGDRRTGRKLLMVGAGAGVAPLVSLLEAERYEPGDAALVVRDTADPDALLREPISSLIRERGVRHFPLTGPRAGGNSPWLPATHTAWNGPDLLRYIAPDPDEYDVYLCGPDSWMRALREDLRGAGFTADRIHSESFTP